MNFIQQFLIRIFEDYHAPQPLNLFLKDFFSRHRQLGSRDRKAIRDGVYAYYRWRPFTDSEGSPLQLLKWCIEHNKLSNPYLVKMMEDIPYRVLNRKEYASPLLSAGLDTEQYQQFLTQLPALFIRLPVPGQQNILEKIRTQSGDIDIIDHLENGQVILKLPNSFPLQSVLDPHEYIVQDYASQRSILRSKTGIERKVGHIWDVCSGAGGKSILLSQVYRPQHIISFDVRPSILKNLRHRAGLYGIKNIKTVVHDWSQKPYQSQRSPGPDLIVCDVPCSGSGTWGRTPEQISESPQALAEKMSELQSGIMDNVLNTADKGTYILYITCSIFRQENEWQTGRLQKTYHVQVLKEELLFGLDDHSDCMYYALMRKV